MRPWKCSITGRETPASAGVPGPGETTTWVGCERLGLLGGDAVVAGHVHLRAGGCDVVHQVVGERVVVVDHEHLHGPYTPVSAWSMATASAAILFIASWYSPSGLESATTPPPDCR